MLSETHLISSILSTAQLLRAFDLVAEALDTNLVCYTADTMTVRKRGPEFRQILLLLAAGCILIRTVQASVGDRLPEFRECVKVLSPH